MNFDYKDKFLLSLATFFAHAFHLKIVIKYFTLCYNFVYEKIPKRFYCRYQWTDVR